MLKGAGLHVPSDVVTHGLLALSPWAHCEAEHHGGESTAKQETAVLTGLGRSKMKRKEADRIHLPRHIPVASFPQVSIPIVYTHIVQLGIHFYVQRPRKPMTFYSPPVSCALGINSSTHLQRWSHKFTAPQVLVYVHPARWCANKCLKVLLS